MGNVYAEIEIVNSHDLALVKRHVIDPEEVKRMHITVMVDSGAWKLCINENIQSIMDLPFLRKEGFRLADGKAVEYDLVGPVLIKHCGREANCEAIVFPEDTRPLLGVVPMESLNLIIHPQRHELLVNTEGPFLVGIYKDEAS
jgi:clan AA aspartic protease